jgi:DNA-binding Xre family transcriptional regulator
MEITVHIKEIAEGRGIKSAYALWKEVGGSKEMVYGLWRGDFKMIGLDTLAKLCRVLRCQPGKLLKFEAEGG